MALWQYVFHPLPNESVKRLPPDPHFIDGEEGFDNETYWLFNSIKREFFDPIGTIFEKNKSWSEDIDLYAGQESNCFEVLIENGVVISASFRIDFRSDYEAILSQLIEFFILNDCIVLNEELNLIPLNLVSFKNIIDSPSRVSKYKELSRNR